MVSADDLGLEQRTHHFSLIHDELIRRIIADIGNWEDGEIARDEPADLSLR